MCPSGLLKSNSDCWSKPKRTSSSLSSSSHWQLTCSRHDLAHTFKCCMIHFLSCDLYVKREIENNIYIHIYFVDRRPGQTCFITIGGKCQYNRRKQSWSNCLFCWMSSKLRLCLETQEDREQVFWYRFIAIIRDLQCYKTTKWDISLSG